MRKRQLSYIACSHTQKHTHNTLHFSLSLSFFLPCCLPRAHSCNQHRPGPEKMKRQEFFSRGKLERALCRVALMVHKTHTFMAWGDDDAREGERRRGCGNWKTCLFICSRLLKLGCLAVSCLLRRRARARTRERRMLFSYGLLCVVL